LGEKYNISHLTLEDIVNQLQRPKVEDYGHYIFTVLKEIHFDDEYDEVTYEQISIITMGKTVLTFIDKETNIFDPVIRRIKKDRKLRKFGTDYLTYALIDIVVDHYFFVLESFEEWFEDVEKIIAESPETEIAQDINKMRTELSIFNKIVWPLSTVVEKLEKMNSKLIKKSTRVYFRDVYDHLVRITEAIETDREIVSGIFDLYNAGISKRLNETIRILTVISTIFIPLTFIAGVYGMNFDNMPELYWEYGYYICIAAMFTILVTMLLFFKKKRWF
jgi:magnesium transporter